MKFEISDEDMEKIHNWEIDIDKKVAQKQLESGEYKNNSFVMSVLESGRPYYGAIGGSVEYCFSFTSIGQCLIVKHPYTGEELNLTHYEDW